jgi:hypothetical protein
MLTEPGQIIYENGVRQTENAESRLRRSVSVYHKELGDNLDRPEMKNRRREVQPKAAAKAFSPHAWGWSDDDFAGVVGFHSALDLAIR